MEKGKRGRRCHLHHHHHHLLWTIVHPHLHCHPKMRYPIPNQSGPKEGGGGKLMWPKYAFVVIISLKKEVKAFPS